MSKLIFPKHGGMHIDDDDRIVRTVKHRDRDGTYTIKIVSHPSVFPHEKQYQWHYLSPWGGTGSTSGYRDSIKGSIEGAIESIKSVISRERKQKAEARKSPEQKARDRLRANARFFREQGAGKNSEELAKAEREAEERGWKVEWEFDEDEYQMGDEEQRPNEVLCAVLKDENGDVLESLGGIGDPSKDYARMVEAELSLEALSHH
jgi:hypothetical protein